MLLDKGNAVSWCTWKRDSPIDRKTFPGVRDLSRGWECDVRKDILRGRHRMVKQSGRKILLLFEKV